MAENHLLTYYGIIGSVGSELEAECDQASYEDDNGEAVSVRDARPIAADIVRRAIERLMELQNDIAKLPMKQLRAKYETEGGSDDY